MIVIIQPEPSIFYPLKIRSTATQHLHDKDQDDRTDNRYNYVAPEPALEELAELKAGFINNAPVGLLVAGTVLAELVALFFSKGFGIGLAKAPSAVMPHAVSGISNTEALGRILYTKYAFFFQGAGLILLVAMVGAIVLTLRKREGVKRQSVSVQNARDPATAIEIVKVPTGSAVVPSAEAQR